MINKTYVDDKVFLAPAGTPIKSNSRDYRLRQDIEVPYLDHQRVYAGIYVEDPLRSGNFIRRSPNLEEGDIARAVKDVLDSLAREFESLQDIKKRLEEQGKELSDQEKTNLKKLDQLLEAA